MEDRELPHAEHLKASRPLLSCSLAVFFPGHFGQTSFLPQRRKRTSQGELASLGVIYGIQAVSRPLAMHTSETGAVAQAEYELPANQGNRDQDTPDQDIISLAQQLCDIANRAAQASNMG
jgi:hypothetical protein